MAMRTALQTACLCPSLQSEGKMIKHALRPWTIAPPTVLSTGLASSASLTAPYTVVER